LIDSADELGKQVLALEKNQQKLVLLKDQINIRKKLLNQKIKVPLSKQGNKWPIKDIIDELITHIRHAVLIQKIL